MAGHSERLLAQALHLAKRDRFRPEQANLRRAISTAYYAMFHAIVGSASALLAGAGANERTLRLVLARTFTHTEMQRASRAFASGTSGLPGALSPALEGTQVSDDLRRFAGLFHRLQDDRHEADYDLSVRWRRGDVLVRISAVESCLGYLRRNRSAKDLRVYLASLLVWNRISNR
jgi:hypothetical protein